MKPLLPLLAAVAALPSLVLAGEFTVEKKPFKATVSIDGTFLPDATHNLQLDPKAWTDFTITDLVPQGGLVKAGEPVVTLETKDIDRKLADDADATKLRKMALAASERDLAVLEKTTPWRLEVAERAYQRAKDDDEYFTKVSRPLDEEMTKRSLEGAEHYLEGATEELKQLLKMYKEDDLTEETEEIILKRQRYQVDAAEFRLKTSQLATKRSLEVSIPRQAIDQSQAMKDAEVNWNTLRESLPQALEQKRLEVKKARIEDQRGDEASADLKADRAQMNLVSPVTGRVYHGEIEDGRWNPANAAKFMKVGAKLPPKVIFAVVIPEQATLQLHAFVEEPAAARLKAGQTGYVAPTAAPRSRLAVSVVETATFPAVDGKYHAVLKVDGKPADFELVAGMNGKAKISTGTAADDSIAIPTKALNEEPDGSYTVKVKREGDKVESVPVTVGAESDGSILVLSGLEPGQVLLTPDANPAEAKK